MRKGFTLIELLVVVLIIGILAAVALPQYDKAVWKSRAVQLRTGVKSIADAQEVFYMANGSYAAAYSQLDVNFDNLENLTPEADGTTVSSGDSIRGTDNFSITLNVSPANGFAFTNGQFTKGKFAKNGFIYFHEMAGHEKQMVCFEHINTPEGSFCAQVMGTSRVPIAEKYRLRYYALP